MYHYQILISNIKTFKTYFDILVGYKRIKCPNSMKHEGKRLSYGLTIECLYRHILLILKSVVEFKEFFFMVSNELFSCVLLKVFSNQIN